ncbi:hypothetical protein XENOCAPTIV_006628 [Xenoophorus captivus]|uniref:Uncharacterized protein n=1 Tax=Xenoophorus captivus TaxID=1517983 RepID=A0ABV0RP39_9TELE
MHMVPKGNLEGPNVFGLWEETGLPSRDECLPKACVLWMACREHANSIQKDPGSVMKPRTFLLQDTSVTNCANSQPLTRVIQFKRQLHHILRKCLLNYFNLKKV